MEDEIHELNDPGFTEDDFNESPPKDIVAFNELRSCADLARMEQEGVIDLQPDFQRDVVWQSSDQTRFIDSLIKQLPIPSMCFALDYKKDEWIVIDGLQRMTAIRKFLTGGDWRLSRLDDIDQRIAGKLSASFKESKGDLRKLFDRVQNKTLPITVLRCDMSKKTHLEYLFTIFHRLNSGGTKLNNQEIRNCIYGGSLNQMLRDLDQNGDWRKINNMDAGKNYRYVKQELILRFFAFFDRQGEYSGQVGKFLNDYMHDHRNPSATFIDVKSEIFLRTVEQIRTKIFPNFSDGQKIPRIPTAVMEALLVGIARNIDHVQSLEVTSVKERYDELRASEHFKEEGVAEGLSKKDKVFNRMAAATEIFAD